MKLIVPKVEDFAVTGDGAAKAWDAAAWQPMARVGNGSETYATQAKVVYSDKGIYFLVDCEDRKLTCTMTKDFDNLFTEDVVEVFLWPYEPQILYFEYEISPLGPELPILVPNHKGRFHGWLPWHYEGERKVRRATSVRGGKKESGASVTGWTVEFFMPFSLFAGMGNTPPARGSSWRANMYRIDYDASSPTQWAWCTDTGGNFHKYDAFGTFVFE